MNKTSRCLTGGLLGLCSALAGAQADSDASVRMDAPAASDQRLDALRGGADIGPDLHISFGLERSTTVNGVVVATTQFQLQDIGHVTLAEGQAAQRVLGSLLTVHDGQVTTAPLAPGNQSLATVIQNSLPNQTIKNVLTLTMTTNSLAMLRAANAADQLRNLSMPGH